MDARVSDEGRPGESGREACDRRANPDKLMARGKQGWFAHPHAPATDVCPDKYEKLLKYFQELFCFTAREPVRMPAGAQATTRYAGV